MKELLYSICNFIKENPKLFLAILFLIVFSFVFLFAIIGLGGVVPLALYVVITILTLSFALHYTNRQKEPALAKLFLSKRKATKVGAVPHRIYLKISPLAIRITLIFVLVTILVGMIFFVSDVRVKATLLLGALAIIPAIIYNPDTWHRRVAASLILLVNITQLGFAVTGQMPSPNTSESKPPKTFLSEQSETSPGTAMEPKNGSHRPSLRGRLYTVHTPMAVQVLTIIAAIIIYIVGERRLKR